MIAWLQQTANWMSRILSWLRDAYRLWIAIFAIPGVFLICWAVIPSWEPRIRITGMVLELMGLATVALGLRGTRSLFGRPSLLGVGRDWLKRFPRFRSEVRSVAVTANFPLEFDIGSAFGTVGPAPTATIEERVAILEKNVNQIHLLIHETQRKLDQEAQVRQSALESEQREREVGDSKNKQLLEEAAAGGLYLETTGVFWLAFGIILATASNEFAKLLTGN